MEVGVLFRPALSLMLDWMLFLSSGLKWSWVRKLHWLKPCCEDTHILEVCQGWSFTPSLLHHCHHPGNLVAPVPCSVEALVWWSDENIHGLLYLQLLAVLLAWSRMVVSSYWMACWVLCYCWRLHVCHPVSFLECECLPSCECSSVWSLASKWSFQIRRCHNHRGSDRQPWSFSPLEILFSTLLSMVRSVCPNFKITLRLYRLHTSLLCPCSFMRCMVYSITTGSLSSGCSPWDPTDDLEMDERMINKGGSVTIPL